MADENFKKAVISSFSSAKDHISSLENQIEALKNILLRQNEVILRLTERILEVSETSKKGQNEPFFNVSTGNDGVKQSINQSINQTLSTKQPKIPEIDDFLSTSEGSLSTPLPIPKKEIPSIQPNIIENTQKRVKTAQNDILDENFHAFKNNLNLAFGKLSKQELKAFLTVYQLDEANQGASYQELAQKMGLTETCVRAYISSLFKKGLPLVKMKINNKKTLVSIKPDFKVLNLKERILGLYYEKDPYQTSIFDVNE